MYRTLCLYNYAQCRMYNMHSAYRMVGLVDRGRGIRVCVNATKVHARLPFQCVDGVCPPPSCQKGVPVLAEVSG